MGYHMGHPIGGTPPWDVPPDVTRYFPYNILTTRRIPRGTRWESMGYSMRVQWDNIYAIGVFIPRGTPYGTYHWGFHGILRSISMGDHMGTSA